ncbi:MAG: DUF177 domain-containing protein [Bacteroidetes bacterium]|nr:MAG: DUF177 domain-containing protein [Bacteroidota bacterium]
MDALIQYSIPVKGLGDGIHEYRFHIDKDFFDQFEHSPIKEGTFDVHFVFDKRPEMFDLSFDFKGKAKAACDRCLATVDLPVEGENRLLVKFGEEKDEDADVIFVSPEISSLNVAKFIYEYICLAMPLINVFDCESMSEPPCDKKMLKYLEQRDNDENDNDNNPIWDDLKNAFNN